MLSYVAKIFKYICITNMMFEITSELAEICGIHAGDGYLRNDGKRKELDISGSTEEQVYYEEYVIPLVRKVFNIDIKGKFFPSRNTYGFVVRNKEIINFFHKLGFPYGNKTLIVAVPDFVLNNKEFSYHFLRGLLDIDGHINFRKFYGKYKEFKTKYANYPSIQFTSVSKTLIQQISLLIEKLGLTFNIYTRTPKRINENISYKITLNGIKNMEKWMEMIGSKNEIKLSRYRIWKKFGFCPTRLSFKQREDILKGKLDPYLLGS